MKLRTARSIMCLRGVGAAAAPGTAGILVTLRLGGCASETPQPATASDSKLSPTAQQLLEALVKQTLTASERVVRNAGPQDATAVYQVLGSGELKGNDAHLAMRCEQEKEFLPTCGSSLPGNQLLMGQFDTCFSAGCTGPNLAYVDVYVTSPPHRAPTDRVKITYPMGKSYPAGTVTYDPNPLTHWTIDSTDPSSLHVHADLDENIRVEVEGEAPLDFSYVGTVDGTNAGGRAEMSLSMTLAMLSASEPVQVSLTHHSDAPTVGNIVTGEKTLADIAESSVIWRAQ